MKFTAMKVASRMRAAKKRGERAKIHKAIATTNFYFIIISLKNPLQTKEQIAEKIIIYFIFFSRAAFSEHVKHTKRNEERRAGEVENLVPPREHRKQRKRCLKQ